MPEASTQIQHYARLLRRQWWLIALTTILAIVAAYGVTKLLETQYKATMKIVVGQGGGVFQPQFGGSAEPFAQTMTNLLKSDVVARSVIEMLGLDTTAEHLLQGIDVTNAPESSVLEVSYVTSDRDNAVATLAAVGDVFTTLIDEQLGQDADPASGFQPITATVFDPAHLEPRPVSPRPVRNLAIAGALGLVLGVILALVRGALDRRIRTRAEAENAFGASVIGTLPRVPSGGGPYARRRAVQTRQRLAEALRLLRANLEFSRGGLTGPTIVVTSALPEEGKTTFVANLSTTLASAGHRVICVEADIRRPRLQTYLSADRGGPGLVEVLQGKASLEEALHTVQRMSVPFADNSRGRRGKARREHDHILGMTPGGNGLLRILLGGEAPADPSTVLTPDRITQLIQRLRRAADFVIFDTPPLLLVGDAYPLISLGDATIVVARAGRTTTGEAAAVRETMEGLGAAKVFVVLTDSDERLSYDYGYGYGSERAAQSRREKPERENRERVSARPGENPENDAEEVVSRRAQ